MSQLPPSVCDFAVTTVEKLLSEAHGEKTGALADRLLACGLEPSRAASFAEAARRLLAAGVEPSTRATAFWVPGRIEVMGKHTDYCAGRSLLCAVNKGFAVVSADRPDNQCRILATFELAGTDAEATVSLCSTASAALPEGWALYPAATMRRLARNFGISHGVDLALSCDLPEASGMSSSSAVIIATFLALSARNSLAARLAEHLPTAEDLCHYLGCIENGQDCGPSLPGDAGVGTFGGSEDHTAIMLCAPAQLRQYAFCPTRLEASIPFPAGMCMLIAVSGATAQKGAERLKDYNDAAMLARFAAAAAAASANSSAEGAPAMTSPPPTTLAGAVAAEAERLGVGPLDAKVHTALASRISALDDGTFAPDGAAPKGALLRRFQQFYEESEQLVPWVGAAFATADADALGTLVDRSQELTTSHLRNTLEETEWLPAAARRLGAHAASAFGAGFGGSVWALAAAEEADTLLQAWEREYAQRYPQRSAQARFFAMRSPAPGARSVG